MTEFSVFVGEKKVATIFADGAIEAIAAYREQSGCTKRDVWAMQAKVL